VTSIPNHRLHGLQITNVKRSGGMSDTIEILIDYKTTLAQIEKLKKGFDDFCAGKPNDFVPEKCSFNVRELRETNGECVVVVAVVALVLVLAVAVVHVSRERPTHVSFFLHLMLAGMLIEIVTGQRNNWQTGDHYPRRHWTVLKLKVCAVLLHFLSFFTSFDSIFSSCCCCRCCCCCLLLFRLLLLLQLMPSSFRSSGAVRRAGHPLLPSSAATHRHRTLQMRL
jgi:hypothetical protein